MESIKTIWNANTTGKVVIALAVAGVALGGYTIYTKYVK